LGINFGQMKFDLAFDQSDRNIKYPFYSVGLTNAASVDSRISNVTGTLSFNL